MMSIVLPDLSFEFGSTPYSKTVRKGFSLPCLAREKTSTDVTSTVLRNFFSK